MLKADWEKADELEHLKEAAIREMAAVSGRPLQSYDVISGGCANLNVKLVFADGKPPLILRVYLRDPQAGAREKLIAERLSGAVPAPRVEYLGNFEGRRFALAQYVEGITLRDLILGGKGADIAPAMQEAGGLLAALGRLTFESGGAFDENLQVKPAAAPDYIEFANGCLVHPYVTGALTAPIAAGLGRLLEKNRADFPSEAAPCLVHGDYDPANILVRETAGVWKISSVLDWEFAAAGSYLWDVSNMLRDAHRLPPLYGASFLQGLEAGGARLPGNWRRTICLTNITSLLYMLRQCRPETRPRARADMVGLLAHFASELEKKSSFLSGALKSP